MFLVLNVPKVYYVKVEAKPTPAYLTKDMSEYMQLAKFGDENPSKWLFYLPRTIPMVDLGPY